MIPLPAKLKLVLGVLLIGGIGALQALAKVEPAWTWAGAVVQVLMALELYITVPAAAQAKLAAAKLAAAATKPLSVLFMILLVACGLTGAQAVTDVVTGLNAAACVLNTVSADKAAGKPEADAIVDAVLKCGVSAAQAGGILDAHRKAEVQEGFVPRAAK